MSEPTGTQYGGFWVRLIALLADSAIVFLVSALVLAGAVVALGTESLVPVSLIVSLFGLLYWPLMHASRGQATFGKAIVGLKITRFDGRRISILRALWRELAKLFSGAVLMLGYLMAAFTPRKQGLHDLMSATYVVREGPARIVAALAVAVAGFVVPVVVGPMVVGAAALSSMTSMAEGLILQHDPMKLAARPVTPAKAAPKALPKAAPAPQPAKAAPPPPPAAPAPVVVAPAPVVVAQAPVVEQKPATPEPLAAVPLVEPKAPATVPAKPKVAKAKPKTAPAKTVARTTWPTSPSHQKLVSGLRHNDLMTAVLDGDVDSVNELLKLGKWADKPDSRGATPLMVAAERGDVRTAEALLRAGANARLAVPVAEERRNGEMVQLLKRHTR